MGKSREVACHPGICQSSQQNLSILDLKLLHDITFSLSVG